MSDSTELTVVQKGNDQYKLTRVRMAELMESYTGDKGQALELLERWERGVWAGVLLAAPTAQEAKEAFAVASTAFLEVNHG